MWIILSQSYDSGYDIIPFLSAFSSTSHRIADSTWEIQTHKKSEKMRRIYI
jgi:hypothetical protein